MVSEAFGQLDFGACGLQMIKDFDSWGYVRIQPRLPISSTLSSVYDHGTS